MGWTITYQKLVELKIMHHYFLDMGASGFDSLSPDDQARQLFRYNVPGFLTIRPTKETAELLKGYRLRFKNTNTGFIIGAEQDITDPTKPFITPDPNAVMRFTIHINDALFDNYSLLPAKNDFYTDAGEHKIFIFSNSGHTEDNAPELSLRVPEYDATPDNAGGPGTFLYLAGDLVRDTGVTNEIFEALRHNNDALSVADSWKSITTPHLFYVSAADKLRVYKSLHNYTFETPDIEATITITNRNGDTVRLIDDISTANGAMTHQIDMRSLSPGQYRLRVTDNSDDSEIDLKDFYLDDFIKTSGAFGLIELSFAEGLGNYGLLDGAGSFRNPAPEFNIRFRNRYTNWQYKNAQDQSDVAGVTGVDAPLPFTRDGFISVQLNSNDLPNPAATLYKIDGLKLVSEIFIDENLYA